MDIEQISKDGFYLNKILPDVNNLALISLRSSLKAYFETYKSLHAPLKNVVADTDDDSTIKNNFSITYVEKCCQSITNFHHFIELVLKDILTAKHPLLAIDVSKQHSTLHDLIFNIEVDQAEIEKTKLLEFSEALQRVVELINSNKLDQTKYQFIADSKVWLTKLNTLRNRIAHRGVFVIKYKALDFLFGKFALPLLLKIISLPEYSSSHLWKYKRLSIELDPIEEIINSFNSTSPRLYDTYERVALLKQLSVAAYNNPLIEKEVTPSGTWITTFLEEFDKEEINRSKALSDYVEQNENVHKIDTCPVCGTKTLVHYNDYVDVEDEKGNTLEYFEIVYRVQCFCCSFELKNEISQIDSMGLPICNFWNTV